MLSLRAHFDADPLAYNLGRPAYPPELFRDLFAYAQLSPPARVLEIGVGTGQASLPFLEAGFDLHALELGPRLAAFAREKFGAWPNFQLTEGDFMALPLPAQAYDLVFSASAFHWLPKGPAYQRVRRLLKPGGTLALFWAHSAPAPEETGLIAIRSKYSAQAESIGQALTIDFYQRVQRKLNGLKRRGFTDLQSHCYSASRSLDALTYLALLRSSNRHQALNPATRGALEQEIIELAGRSGGKLTILDQFDLYLGRN